MTSRRLSRRALLRSAGGLAIALPLLEQMMPTRSMAAAASPPKRFMGVFFPSGFIPSGWKPTATGKGYTLTPTLQPLAALQGDFLVISGLDKKVADNSHHGGTSGLLTGTSASETTSKLLPDPARPIARSIDQYIADKIGTTTTKRSVHTLVTAEPYACGDLCGNISWSNKDTPLGTETDPKALFDSLFAGIQGPAQPAGPSPDQVLAYQLDKSILDYVLDDTTTLRTKLGRTDQQKLDEYLTGVRSLEQQLKEPGSSSGLSCTPGSGPAKTTDIRTRIKNMMDVVVLGLTCDITRVATLMIGFGRGNWVFDFLGLDGGHHDDYSHHDQMQPKIDGCLAIEKWEMEQLAYLLGRMKAVVEPGGATLLDNSLVYMSSDVSDGQAHSQKDLPILLAGRGAGAVSPGRHLAFAGLPHTNLFVSLLQTYDIAMDKYNDSTGALTGLAG